MHKTDIKKAVEIIKNAKHLVVFTGAGISVESGIPTFRGENGLWSRINPDFIDLDVFINNPQYSWDKIKEIFYEFMGDSKPNDAHIAIAKLEEVGIVKSIITQNIDNLHQDAGSKNVIEFHGTTKTLSCLKCEYITDSKYVDLSHIPLLCPKCDYLLKPNFIFFGEKIEPEVVKQSYNEAKKADVMLVIGTTGDVMPACQIPIMCKFPNIGIGGTIIEINTNPSSFTTSITDIFLQGKATVVLNEILNVI